MKAVVLQAIGKVVLTELPPPEPREDELLIRMGASTICTSDLNDIRSNPFGITLPITTGHEAAGTVVRVGAAVHGFTPGDRVTTHPVHPCYHCDSCQRGLAHLCDEIGHFAYNRPGTFAEFFTVRQDRVRKIPADLDFAVAALAEPVAVCLEALQRARLKAGDRLLIIGDGPFGILMARLAALRELAALVVSGHHDFRLSLAGEAVTFNARQSDDPRAGLLRLGGGGYDAVIMAVGIGDVCRDAIHLLRARGRLVLFSPMEGEVPLDLTRVLLKELEIVGACNDEDLFDEAVGLLSDPALALGDLITHRFALEDFARALATASEKPEQAMKVALINSP